MTRAIEVLGLGNSLVDILALAKDDYLVAQNMLKGAMTLIDEPRAENLYAARIEPTIMSGGSAANTIVGVGSFGVKGAYIGKVKDDALGHAFTHDIRAMGVDFATVHASEGPATGRCFVYVTPDGERTMNTYLGASTFLSPPDVDEALVRAAGLIYLEGYMWDRPAAKSAFQKAAEIAHEAGARVALTLSDSFCVDRFRPEFLDLMRRGLVDIVFSNTEEVLSLYQTADLAAALGARRAERVARSSCVGKRRAKCPPFRSSASSTRRAPAIFSPPAFWRAWRAAPIITSARASARWPPPKSSSIWAPVRR
jgi:sugar/nucleoside kinase (ribokinase family)